MTLLLLRLFRRFLPLQFWRPVQGLSAGSADDTQERLQHQPYLAELSPPDELLRAPGGKRRAVCRVNYRGYWGGGGHFTLTLPNLVINGIASHL